MRIEPAIFKIFSTITNRNSHRRCSIKKGVLKNFAKFTGKHLCQSLFFNNTFFNNFIKKETVAQVLSCEFTKFLRKPFLQNTSKQLLLYLTYLPSHPLKTEPVFLVSLLLTLSTFQTLLQTSPQIAPS